MTPEAKKKIMGFFIEDARVCLQTLEQGLPGLSERSADSELIDDLYRAVHSIKGGAAMLDVGSVRLTAHKMEDTFKVFRERKIRCDRTLESLLQRCYKTLTHLIDRLQLPEGLSPEDGNGAIMAIEPVFQQLEMQVKVLQGEISAEAAAARTAMEVASLQQIPSRPEPPRLVDITPAPVSSQPQPHQALDVTPRSTASPSQQDQPTTVAAPAKRPNQSISPQSSDRPKRLHSKEIPPLIQDRPSLKSYLSSLRRLFAAIFQYIKYLLKRAIALMRDNFS